MTGHVNVRSARQSGLSAADAECPLREQGSLVRKT
jgi:hypothetical protein